MPACSRGGDAEALGCTGSGIHIRTCLQLFGEIAISRDSSRGQLLHMLGNLAGRGEPDVVSMLLDVRHRPSQVLQSARLADQESVDGDGQD